MKSTNSLKIQLLSILFFFSVAIFACASNFSNNELEGRLDNIHIWQYNSSFPARFFEQDFHKLILNYHPELKKFQQYKTLNLSTIDGHKHDFNLLIEKTCPNLSCKEKEELLKKYMKIVIEKLDIPNATEFAPIPEKDLQEFLLYLQGCRDMARNDFVQGNIPQAWLDLLKLPAEQRFFRTTWAYFMCGNTTDTEKDYYYEQTRNSAFAGFSDVLSLAPRSIYNNYRHAPNGLIRYYYLLKYEVVQSLLKDKSLLPDNAINKYITLNDSFYIKPADLKSSVFINNQQQKIQDSQLFFELYIGRRIYLLFYDSIWDYEPKFSQNSRQLFNILKEGSNIFLKEKFSYINDVFNSKSFQKIVADSSVLSDFLVQSTMKLDKRDKNSIEIINKFLEQQKTTSIFYAWQKAEEARRNNDFDNAEKYYKQWLDAYTKINSNQKVITCINQQKQQAYTGLLALSRKNFFEALDLFIFHSFSSNDAIFIAEKCMSCDELKGYVDNCIIHFLNEKNKKIKEQTEPKYIYLEKEYGSYNLNPISISEDILKILIIKLNLQKRFAEALEYQEICKLYNNFTFGDDLFSSIQQMIHWQNISNDEKLDKNTRAIAKINCAIISRHKGEVIFGCFNTCDDDYYGNRVETLKQHRVYRIAPYTTYHYRYFACEYLQEAAELFEDPEDKVIAYALAGIYMKNKTPNYANRYYVRIVHLNAGKLSKEISNIRWFPTGTRKWSGLYKYLVNKEDPIESYIEFKNIKNNLK